MPYLQTPAGNSILVPDGMSYEDALAKARAKFPQEFGIKPQEGVIAGVKKGTEQMVSSGLTGLKSLFGDAQQAAVEGAARSEGIGNRYANQVDWDRVSQKYNDPQGGLFPAMGEVARQVPLAIAEQAPNIAATMGSAKLGAMAGTAVAPGVGTLIGGGIGAMVPSFLQQFGGNVERQQQATPGQINVGTAGAAAVPQAGLEAAATFIPLGKTVIGKVLGPTAQKYLQRGGEQAAEKLAKERLLTVLAKGTGVGAMAEIPTEVTQQMLERMQAGLPLTDADAMQEYGRTAYQVGLLAPIGGAGRYIDRGAARDTVETTQRATAAKAAQEAAAADEARKQTPEYLQQLSQQYDTLKGQRDALGAQIKQLRAASKDPATPKDEKRAIEAQLRDLTAQLGTAVTEFNKVAPDFDKRSKDISALKEQQRVAGMSPYEYAYGVNPEEGLNMAQIAEAPAPVRAVAPPAPFDPIRSHLEDAVSPMVRMAGVAPTDVLEYRQTVAALLERPDLAKRVIEGSELFPGTTDDATSRLWKRELKDQLKAALKEPKPDTTRLPIQAYQQGLEQLQEADQAALGKEMGAGREAAARQRATQEQVAAIEAERAAKRAAEEAAAWRAAPDAEAQVREQGLRLGDARRTPETVKTLENAIDEGIVTPTVARALSIDGIKEELDLRKAADAARALPLIQARIDDLVDQQRQTLGNDKVQLTDPDGALTRNGQEMQRVEAVLTELRRLKTHAERAGQGASDESFVQGALEAATPKRQPSVDVGVPLGQQPQMYTLRAKQLAEQFDDVKDDLYSQLDELARGAVFRDPKASQIEIFDPLKRRERALDTKHAMQMESTLTRKAAELRQKIVQTILQEGASRREASGAKGLTSTEAIRASMDVRSAIDALIDKSRRVDDSGTTFEHDPTKDKLTKDSYGHLWVIKGGRSITDQQARAKDDPVYGTVRSQPNFTEAAKAANAIIEQARQALAAPPAQPRTFQKGPFQLSPQTEERLQATDKRAAGAGLPTEGQRTSQRVENTIDRIEQFAPRAKGMTAALLEKVRQFLFNATDGNTRLANARIGAEMLDNVDSTLDRVSKGMPADPATAQAVLDRINSIERNVQDTGAQPDMFAEPTALMADNPEQFQRMVAERMRQAPVAQQKAAAAAAEARHGFVPAGLAAQAKIKRLDDTIEQARQRLARLEALVRTKADSAKLGIARVELRKLEEMASLAAMDVKGGKVPRSLSAAFAQLNEVNAASDALRKALAVPKAAPAVAKRPAPAEQPKPYETAQPVAAAPGTEVTRSKVSEVPLVVTRGKAKYDLGKTTFDEEGNYVPPVTRQQVERTTVQTPEERKKSEREALRAKVREEMEDRARQKALKEELRAKGVAQEMTPAERATMMREMAGAASSRKGESIRKNLPRTGKGAPETELRAAAKTRETPVLPEPGTPPEAPMPKRVGKSLKKQAYAENLAERPTPVSPRLAERVAEAKAAKARVQAQREAIKQQHLADAAKQAEARKKKSVSKTETPATGGSTVEALNAAIAAEFGDTKGLVTVVPTRADMPAEGRAVTIDGEHVYIAADEVSPTQVRGLVLHELGVHVGMDADLVGTLHTRLEEMAQEGGEHAALAQQALDYQKKSTSTDTRDEAVAHFVELAANAGISPTTGLPKFFKPLTDFVKKVMVKFGLSSDKLTAQDIVDFARGAVDKAVAGQRANKGASIQYSSTPKYADGYDRGLQDISKRLISEPATWRKKMRDHVLGFRMHFIDAFDPLEKIASTMADSVKATQMMYWLRMYKQASNATNEIALNGTLYVDKIKRPDGRTEYMVKSRVGENLRDIAKELKHAGVGDLDAADREFKTYLVAERAERTGYESVAGHLPEGSDKQPLVSEAELKQVLAAGRANPAFQTARKMYEKYANGLIDFAVETGAIEKSKGEELKSGGDYVSFYRRDGDAVNLIVNGERIGTIGSIKSQPHLQELVGGTSQITGFLEGALQNTRLLTEMALRNMATKNTANTLAGLGLAEISTGDGPGGKNVIRFKDHGNDKYAVIDTDAIGIPTEILVTGLEGISTQLPAAFRAMGVPARLLRQFIVRNPLYAARQVFRDSMANALLAGVDGVPVASQLKEIGKMVAGRSDAERRLQERLIVGGQTLTGDMDDRATILKQIGSGQLGWQTAMAKLDFWAMQADASSRVTAYNSARANGLTDMEASLAALETMNFNRRGVSPTMHALGTMIPFMNAQIQGLDVLYRAFTGKMPFSEQLKIKQKLYTRGLMLAASTMAYAAMMQGDDEYENASMQDKLNNWLIPVPGTDSPIRIPIPFEVGYLFKALPEAVMILANDDKQAKEVVGAIGQMALNSMPGIVPQGVKPFIEDILNRQFYGGREIENVRMQGLKIGERYGDRTTQMAKELGGSFEMFGHEIGVSPARIEHYVRGFTGSLGMAILGMADGLLPSATERPTRKINETPIFGPLFLEKDATAAINSAYSQIETYERTKATFDKMAKEGRREDALKFFERYSDQIARAQTASRIKAELGQLTKAEAAIRAADKTGDEKRAMLDDVRKLKIQVSRMALEALHRAQ